ncbi:MAG TPA: CPBP family intramembrane metalloprotease [Anaerolineaceae bacterium]|nr:CPBP family intramembrane metalloprotease [Anaerolineaceae bacterium]
MKKYWKIIFSIILTFIATAFLFVFMKSPLFNIQVFDKEILNFYANYEFSTLIVSSTLLLALYLLADKLRLGYFNLRKVDGAVNPVPLLGIKPGERWKTIGVSIGLIITIVTGIVVYFQVVPQNGLTFRFFPEVPLILLFALMNSFTEEVIFRLSYTTIVANENGNPRISEFLSAAVFGGVHYFGIAPSGIAGALMAAFIGWFLAKSINETKGFFWAWVIHFAQDVVILFFLFMSN